MRKETALITGSNKGLGKALALVFASNNHDVIIHGREIEDLAKVEGTISGTGVSCYTLSGDLRLNETIEGLYRLAEEKNVSILINNAGTDLTPEDAGPDLKLPLNEVNDEQVDELLITNLITLIKLTRRIYTLFLSKGYGTIININSICGLEAHKLRSLYCASKWGLRGFTDSLRLEAEKNNIRVIGVYPTRIKTRDYFTFGMEPQEVAQKIYTMYSETSTSEIILDDRPKKQ